MLKNEKDHESIQIHIFFCLFFYPAGEHLFCVYRSVGSDVCDPGGCGGSDRSGGSVHGLQAQDHEVFPHLEKEARAKETSVRGTRIAEYGEQ